jgi:hypothetical protein
MNRPQRSLPGGFLGSADAGIDGTVEQAKSASTESAFFTNCGGKDHQKTLVKPAGKKLSRVPFMVSRLMEFCTRRELVNQTGHDVSEWPLVILKELTDNAIDEAEEAGLAPKIWPRRIHGSIRT